MKILAMGKCVPRQILDNEALSHMVETNDEWITSRTGIRQRRIAKDETVVSMAAEAARQAMERAGTRPEEIGLVLVCTFTPDLATPSVACLVQRELGLSQEILAYDLNAACSGFIYGLVTAEALLSGMEPGKKALIIGAEVISRTVDYTDRGTCLGTEPGRQWQWLPRTSSPPTGAPPETVRCSLPDSCSRTAAARRWR